MRRGAGERQGVARTEHGGAVAVVHLEPTRGDQDVLVHPGSVGVGAAALESRLDEHGETGSERRLSDREPATVRRSTMPGTKALAQHTDGADEHVDGRQRRSGSAATDAASPTDSRLLAP